MKTEVVLKRELFGFPISQKSKSEFFSATDLVKAGNSYRVKNGMPFFNEKQWFNNSSTKEFISELELKYGKIKVSGRGRGSHTWVHPLLFIDLALAINPKLKVEVYEWLFDNLIKYRNDSGDSYREMSAALYVRSSNKREFPKLITEVANKIKIALLVEDWNNCSEHQLAQRDKIHLAIKLYSRVLTDINEIVRLAIKEVTNKDLAI
jgi:hypothetical protein